MSRNYSEQEPPVLKEADYLEEEEEDDLREKER